MYIDPALLPSWLPTAVALAILPWLACAVWYAPWAALRESPMRVHLVAGGGVACLLLWLMNVRGIDGLVFHLLGMTTLTLLLGWSLATLVGTLALVTALLVTNASLIGFFAGLGIYRRTAGWRQLERWSPAVQIRSCATRLCSFSVPVSPAVQLLFSSIRSWRWRFSAPWGWMRGPRARSRYFPCSF